MNPKIRLKLKLDDLRREIQASERWVDYLYTVNCSEVRLARAHNKLDDLNIRYAETLAKYYKEGRTC